MGRVIFDETDQPLMRMTYQGLCDDAEWTRHIEVMSEWARRGDYYGVVIDAREVGHVPATQRRGIMDWIVRDRPHLKSNCAGERWFSRTRSSRAFGQRSLGSRQAPSP